jgi:hypothetical protein
MERDSARSPSQAARKLLGRLDLSRTEVDARLAMALDSGYWKSLYPAFSVGDESSAQPRANALTASQYARLTDHLARRGYFHAESVLESQTIDAMRGCVEAVRSAGWPPVFAYVYDQFWTIWRLAPIKQMVQAGLGEGYRLISHPWCHYVNPVAGASGWPPHVDGNLANRLSVWIPLTDATLDNGCIYLVPGDQNFARIGELRELKSATNLQLRELMQRGRALPASAGSIMGWHFRILHWGSVASGGGHPRISTVMEFIKAEEAGLPSEMPLFDPDRELPPLLQRLFAIGRAINHYKRFELRMRRYAGLGRALMRAATGANRESAATAT